MAQHGGTVYRLKPLSRWAAPISVLVAGLIILAAPWNPAGNNPVWLSLIASSGSVAVIALAIGMSSAKEYARLIVSANGIELREAWLKYFGRVWGFSLESPWDNVERLYEAPDARPALVLRTPLTGKGADSLRRWGNARRTPIYDAEQAALIRQCRVIPLGSFAYLLRDGTLQNEFACYAPWLVPE
jgi:hypothetical protein